MDNFLHIISVLPYNYIFILKNRKRKLDLEGEKYIYQCNRTASQRSQQYLSISGDQHDFLIPQKY